RGQRVVGELLRDLRAGDDLGHLGAHVAVLAEDADDAHRGGRLVAGDLREHALPLAGDDAAFLFDGEHAVARGTARVVGLERLLLAREADAAGELGAAAGDDLLDAPLGAAIADPRRQAYAVAVERRAAEARGDEHVGLAVVALDEAVACGVDANAADDGRGGGRRRLPTRG